MIARCRSRSIWPGLSAAACVLLGGLLALPDAAVAQYGPAVQAAPTKENPFTPRLGKTESWDSNVFRAQDSVTDPNIALGKAGRSDRSSATTVGLKFDKFYSLQHFEADVAETATRYEKFSSLNRNTFDYRGAWHWQLSPRVGGTLSTDHNESVVGFQDLSVGQRQSTVTNDNRVATFDALLFGGWHLLGGGLQLDRKNSVAFQARPDVHQRTGELGLRYVAESQNSIAFIARARRGEFPNRFVDTTTLFIDTGFREREREVNGAWVFSGKSVLTGRLTRIEYRYDHVSERNFSGTAGEARYLWSVTGKVQVALSALRNVLPWTPDTSTSYRIEDTVVFAPTWQIDDKFSMGLVASRLTSDYLGPVVAVTAPLRHDVLRSLQITATWLPFRNVVLGANLRHDRRSSNDAVNTFDAKIGGLTAAISF